MVANPELQPSLDFIKTQQQLFLQNRRLPRSRSRSTLSDATEILTDYDTDSLEASSDSSPYRSAESLAESVTTLSTVDDLRTPDSSGLTSFHFHFDDNPIKGPQGPHLFRNSDEYLDSRPRLTPDWTADKTQNEPLTPGFQTTSTEECERRDTPVVDNSVPPPPPPVRSPPVRSGPVEIEFVDDVTSWSPNQVVQWMQAQGFDESVVEKFFINDISGSILLELQPEDLKELGIASFGKRHQLMACVRDLQRSVHSSSVPSCNSGMSTPDPSYRQDTTTPQSMTAEVGVDCTSPMDDEPCRSRSGSRSSNRVKQQNRPKRGRTEIVPEDSVSIVAIEQLLPKLHMCSKGEDCRKWQRQQVKIARLLQDLQLEGLGGSILVAGDAARNTPSQPAACTSPTDVRSPILDARTPRAETRTPRGQMKSPIVEARPPRAEARTPRAGPKSPTLGVSAFQKQMSAPKLEVTPPTTEVNTSKMDAKTPKSDVTPSLVASSDIMGQNYLTDIQLSQDRLNTMQSRDPQENVRNFLSFQRMSQLQSATDPATPPADQASMSGSPTSPKANPTLAQHLRGLPKLRIPSMQEPSESAFSPSTLAQRTITPSILQRPRQFPTINRERSANPYSSLMSPSDFYRIDPHYGQRTPLSSGDAPLTAVPITPSRFCSQSVPPDMRFGGHHTPIERGSQARLALPRLDNQRTLHSAVNQTSRTLLPVVERSPLPPIDTPEDLINTPRAGHCRHNPFSPGSEHVDDVIHSGWMKKRKTSKLIRHEWEDNHFALRGTHLCMYSDEEDSRRNTKALERIDVDDYAVACSSLPSKSKLTAAFKKTVLKRVNDSHSETAFVFSLIPSDAKGVIERKPFFTGPKSHHFSVDTREQRIDWMRELMLAKALRRGQESGESLNLNGQPF
ncbi:hypothetical protein BJX99DRAFT_240683 [Aspergillus californicus]